MVNRPGRSTTKSESLPRPSYGVGRAKRAPAEERPAPAWHAVARGVALFVASFTLLNIFSELDQPMATSEFWWIDLRPCPLPAARGALSFAAVMLLCYALFPRMNAVRRSMTFATLLVLFSVCLWKAAEYYQALNQGTILSEFSVPFSLHVSAALAVVLLGARSRAGRSTYPTRDFVVGILTVAICAIGFPLAQMHCFGKTDYRRAAPLAVVFAGNDVSGDETAGAPLERVETGSELYRDEMVGRLLLTGGSKHSDVLETNVMLKRATKLGMPQSAIIVDTEGEDLASSVRSTSRILRGLGVGHVLAVSDYYSLPRIHLLYRGEGIEVHTVPAEIPALPADDWRLQLEEVSELWLHYTSGVRKTIEEWSQNVRDSNADSKS